MMFGGNSLPKRQQELSGAHLSPFTPAAKVLQILRTRSLSAMFPHTQRKQNPRTG